MKRASSLLVAVLVSASLAFADGTAKTTLKIEGMTCNDCVPTVKAQLKNTEGVVAYEVSFAKGEALVSYDPDKTSPAQIAESVTKTGYVAVVRSAAAGSLGSASPAAVNAASTNNPDAAEKVTLSGSL